MKKNLYNKIFAPSDCLSQKMLIGYLKGTLNEQDTHRTEEHLVDCELCSEAMEGLMLLKSENVLDKISADIKKVARGKENRKRIAPFGIWMAAAATVVVIIASVVAVRVLTQVNDNQLAFKSPVLSDSLLRNSAPVSKGEKQKSEENSIVEENELGNIIEIDKNPITDQSNRSSIQAEEIKVMSAQKETSKSDDAVEQKIALTDSEVRENNSADLQIETLNSTSSTMMAGAVKPTVQSAAKKRSANTINDNQVVYIHDLKIMDYSSKVIQDKMLEPDLKHTEAQYASPEEKTEKSTAIEFKPTVTYKEKIIPALKAYSDNNYTSSITLFNNLLKENPSDVNALFYSAMSYFNIDNYTEATKLFSVLSHNKDNIFYEEAIFYLAVSQLNLNNKTTAKNLFQEVVELNSFYKARAMEQLNNLND